ncbi:MAG: transposase [Cyclobacteriaceae bacterium]
MELSPEGIFHIYNRGNNKQQIFFSEANYAFFASKLRKHISDKVDILAFCLMPNHFHLLIHTTAEFDQSGFTKAYRILLSSYTRAINAQQGRSGSLFQQHSKAKEMESHLSATVCFNYIHFNPVKTGLVKSMKDWKHSSFNDYLGESKYPLVRIDTALHLLNLPSDPKEFEQASMEMLPDNYRNMIF